MKNVKFYYTCDQKRFEGLKEDCQNWLDGKLDKVDIFNDTYENIRFGEICVDIVAHWDVKRVFLDFYVGGIDSGYGYASDEQGNDEYPYDYMDGTEITFEEIVKCDYEAFQKLAEERIKWFIIDQTEEKTNLLISKAKEELHLW